MKIVNYKKKKANIYELTLSNNDKICLYDDIILKYELLLKKDITTNELAKIKNDNSKLDSYYVALKYLSNKLRYEKEIRNKLKDFDKEAIDYTVNRLKKEGYLNDQLYIKSYINDEVNFKLIGSKKILFDLKKMGFEEKSVNNYLNLIDKNIWLNKIDKYISKKIKTNKNLSAMFLAKKIIQDLLAKGFDIEDINMILDKYSIKDNNDIYEKEYNKIKSKLIKKYSGEELNYRINISLLKKGFKKGSD